MRAGAIYYTDSQIDEKIASACRAQMRTVFDGEVVSISLKPLDFGDKRIVINKPRGYATMFEQILAGLEASSADYVYFLEHDNLYPKEHFDFTPPNKNFWYNRNWWKVRADGLAVSWEASQVSGLCVYRETALKWYRDKVAQFDADNFDRKFEPPGDDTEEWWMSEIPYIDIRGSWNLTYNKWTLDHFRKKETAVNFRSATIDQIPGWDAGAVRAIL